MADAPLNNTESVMIVGDDEVTTLDIGPSGEILARLLGPGTSSEDPIYTSGGSSDNGTVITNGVPLPTGGAGILGYSSAQYQALIRHLIRQRKVTFGTGFINITPTAVAGGSQWKNMFRWPIPSGSGFIVDKFIGHVNTASTNIRFGELTLLGTWVASTGNGGIGTFTSGGIAVDEKDFWGGAGAGGSIAGDGLYFEVVTQMSTSNIGCICTYFDENWEQRTITNSFLSSQAVGVRASFFLSSASYGIRALANIVGNTNSTNGQIKVYAFKTFAKHGGVSGSSTYDCLMQFAGRPGTENQGNRWLACEVAGPAASSIFCADWEGMLVELTDNQVVS